MPLLRHFDQPNTARFITISCFRRFRIFDSRQSIEIFLEELDYLRESIGIKILGYVIMPEHLHIVLWPSTPVGLGFLIGQAKGRAAVKILSAWGEPIPIELDASHRKGRKYQVFERRCYDHNCRNRDVIMEKIIYCHRNPVTRGLVISSDEWPWSSYRWYQGERDVPLVIDEFPE
jgi:putative transposase